MASLARAILAGVPHHVTQRGNGRGQVFFDHADYAAYRDDLRRLAGAQGIAANSNTLST